jgi:hypothetical protein
MYNIEPTTDPSAGEWTCTQHTQADHHYNVTTHTSANRNVPILGFSRVYSQRTTTHLQTHTRSEHTTNRQRAPVLLRVLKAHLAPLHRRVLLLPLPVLQKQRAPDAHEHREVRNDLRVLRTGTGKQMYKQS